MRPTADERVEAEITPDGYLRLPRELCAAHFPQDRCAGLRKDGAYLLLPVSPYAPNAMIMKQRNLEGQRSVLIREVWGDDFPVGTVTAMWEGKHRRLVLTAAKEAG